MELPDTKHDNIKLRNDGTKDDAMLGHVERQVTTHKQLATNEWDVSDEYDNKESDEIKDLQIQDNAKTGNELSFAFESGDNEESANV